MFENILSQPVTGQLSRDVAAAALAPSALFSGPPASGKGAAALELARILSCENPAAPWSCSCTACSRHRILAHPDLLALGPRPFSAEIAAAAAAFLREPGNPAALLLLTRPVRKLLARFSPVLWEDDPKAGKYSPLIAQLEESLEELAALAGGDPGSPGLKKAHGSILKDAFKLEAEGIGETIPIAQIRRASWWARLAPGGKRKFLLIENADRMQEGARNALLKILEEPPDRVNIVLTSSRPEALLPTILSRLRPYRFIRRGAAVESQVIRRVFRDPAAADVLDSPAPSPPRHGPENHITAYLDSFLPVSGEALSGLAAYFAAAVAMTVLMARRRQGLPPPGEELVLLGKYCVPLAEAAGFGRPPPEVDVPGMTAVVLEGTRNFEVRSQFPRFLRRLLDLVSGSLRAGELPPSAPLPWYYDLWRKGAAEADQGVSLWNQSPAAALERFALETCRLLGEARSGPGGGRI